MSPRPNRFLGSWLRIPIEDAFLKRLARILQVIIVAIGAALLLIGIGVHFFEYEAVLDPLVRGWWPLLLLTMIILELTLVRMGQYRLPLGIAIVTLLTVMGIVAVSEGIKEGRIFIAFVLPTTLAVLMLNRFYLWLTAAASTAVVAYVVVAHPSETGPAWSLLMNYCIGLGTVGVLLDRFTVAFRQTLDEERSKRRELALLNAQIHEVANERELAQKQLEEVNRTLEERIRARTEELALLNAELRALALKDPLTGLYNRRGFMLLAERELSMTRRNQDQIKVLLYGDLDYLKEINDHLGHEVGDAALIEAARVFTDVFRDSDLIARMGGDEFVVLGAQTGQESAEKMRKRLYDRLDQINCGGRRDYLLSVSIGWAIYDPRNPQSLEDLLSAADRMMYQEKADRKPAERRTAV